MDVSVHMAQGLVLQRGSRWGFTRVERFLWWAARVGCHPRGGFYQAWQKVPSLPNKRGGVYIYGVEVSNLETPLMCYGWWGEGCGEPKRSRSRMKPLVTFRESRTYIASKSMFFII